MVNNNMGKILLRLPNVATRAFGLQSPGQLARAIPRNKFLYFVQFNQSDGGKAMTNSADFNTYNGTRGISFKVKQVDKPKINLTTVELNQYNKKTLAYTKIDYGDATMRLYDTVDDTVLSMWVDYFTYYFGDSRPKSDLAYDQSPVDASFVDSTGWGLRPLTDTTTFFSSIRVYAFYANTYTAFSYINPKITSVDWTQKEYASSEPEEVNVTFKYEAIKYEKFGQPINNPEDFGWIVENPDALPSSAMVDPGPPKISQPRIFSAEQANVSTSAPAMVPPAAAEQVTERYNSTPTPPTASAPSAIEPLAEFVELASAAMAQTVTFGTPPTSVSTATYGPPGPNRNSLGRSRLAGGFYATGPELVDQTTPIAPGGSSASANRQRMNITYDAMSNVTGTEPVESPEQARQEAVQSTSRQDPVGNSLRRAATTMTLARQQTELIRGAAANSGLITADDRTTQVSGTIEANTVVTRVEANGRSVDLYPTLTGNDLTRVNNNRRETQRLEDSILGWR